MNSSSLLKYTPKKRNSFLFWLLFGLILSIFIHFFILKKLGRFEIDSFNPASFDHIVPRRFHLERVNIDPKFLEESEKQPLPSKPVEVILSEKIDFSNQEIEKPNSFSNTKPTVLNSLELSEEKPRAIKNLVPETLQRPNQPMIFSNEVDTKGNDSMERLISKEASALGNYSKLDQLIEQKKPLSSQTAPILLPTDLLFEYDADQLRPEAEKSLEKLATLIQRNPKAEFIIEGFTDSFGSDEYNLDLSTRRAESIKQWLIIKQFINEKQIKACGLGKSNFLVPSTGSIQAQQLNRRVEIVIRQSDPSL